MKASREGRNIRIARNCGNRRLIQVAALIQAGGGTQRELLKP